MERGIKLNGMTLQEYLDKREQERIDLGRRVYYGYFGGFKVEYEGRTLGYTDPLIDPRTITGEEMDCMLTFMGSDEGIIVDWARRFDEWCKENLKDDGVDGTTETELATGRGAAEDDSREGSAV